MAGPTECEFFIDVYARTVSPALHHVSSHGGQVTWRVNDGKAKVVFEPNPTGDPVSWPPPSPPAPPPPAFDWEHPLTGSVKPVAVGTHMLAICFWTDSGGGGRKEQHSLQACLIVDG